MKQPKKGSSFNSDDKKRLQSLIDDIHEWPSVFMFKYVLPTDAEELKKLKLIFSESAEINTRQSKNGKYTGVTVKEMIMKSETVFERYEKTAEIKGIISL